MSLIVLLLCVSPGIMAQTLDETPAGNGEWGYRPAYKSVSTIDPPSFSWRPMKNMTWTVQCARDRDFTDIVYSADGIESNVHTASKSLGQGRLYWRYRGRNADGGCSGWSTVRSFEITADSNKMPLPERGELLARIPDSHPRLFVRPEDMPELKRKAKGSLKDIYERLDSQCSQLLAEPPDISEPPLYPEGIVRGSEEWRGIWWGNRMRVVKALNGAATLAFTHLLGGPEKYGEEAKRILLACAEWDPKGSTGYLYNDEAGMPYAYLFSRAYTYAFDLLSDSEKDKCRKVMRIRGTEMYNHLNPSHFWKPYNSHKNRAWHFLGEVGIAFHGEIEEADDWTWFAANVFHACYPVWSDDDGGWHEGISYWWEYQERFTWFADVMRSALGIDAFDKPYYSQVGYYAMYLMPPGTYGTGFGDLVGARKPSNYIPLMTTFATQAGNPHWQWWVEKMGGPVNSSEYHAHGDYISYVHGALPKIAAKTPKDLPGSRLFKGTGQAYLNSNLGDGMENVQVVFKSSPFGTQSHGYEASNSFNLWAYGKHLLIRTGRRDNYGSDHHKNWMWSTRSTNCIRINGEDQPKRSPKAKGRISEFTTTPEIDIVTGETEHFTRTIIFVKPELIVVYDRLTPNDPAFYEYWLHAEKEIAVNGQHSITVDNDGVFCDIDFLSPGNLTFSQTNQYDPNPRPRVTLRQWHLTATTETIEGPCEFVTVYRPRNSGQDTTYKADLKKGTDAYTLDIDMNGLSFGADLPLSAGEPCRATLKRTGKSPANVTAEPVTQ